MKHLINALLCLSFASVLAACTKQKQQISQLSVLPAATRNGANTFGALVNGIAYLPTAFNFSSFFADAPLQGVFTPQSFSIHAERKAARGNYNNIYTLNIQADSILLNQGTTYALGSTRTNHFSAEYIVFDGSTLMGITYSTDNTHTGTLRIDSVDYTHNFISGTFSFDAINMQGDVVHVTNGRFDVKGK